MLLYLPPDYYLR